MGGGFSFSRQSFDKTFNRPASDTDYYNLFGSWEWLFDETTSFDIQAGPALIHSNQDAPPSTIANQDRRPFQSSADDSDGIPTAILVVQLQRCARSWTAAPCCSTTPATPVARRSLVARDPSTPPRSRCDHVDAPLVDLGYLPGSEPESVTDTRVTYFANASLTKRWSPTLVSSLTYTRQDDTASGIDGGAMLDAVTLSNYLADLGPLGCLGARGLDAAQVGDGRVAGVRGPGDRPSAVAGVGLPDVASAANLVQIDSSDSLDTQRWGTAARLAYRLTKNTVTALQYAYNKQSSNGDTVGQTSDFDDHLVTFTVQYNFEPIGLWW